MSPAYLILIGLCLALLAIILALGRMDAREDAERHLRLLSDDESSDWVELSEARIARRQRAEAHENITPLGKTRVGIDPRDRAA